MDKKYDIPLIEIRTRLQKTKKEKSLLVRFFLCVFCAIICFGLGYGIFFIQKFQTFIDANTGQKVTLTQKQKNIPLPTIPEPTDQTNIYCFWEVIMTKNSAEVIR
jgi:hypothetical protein